MAINNFINSFIYKLNLKKKLSIQIQKYLYFLNRTVYNFFPALLFFIQNRINICQYIVTISRQKFNLFFHIKTYFGNELFHCSIKSLGFNRQTQNKINLLQKLIHIIYLKTNFLKNKSLSIHIFNVEFGFNWFIDHIAKKSIILSVQNFNTTSYNGCRKKKLRKIKKVAEFG